MPDLEKMTVEGLRKLARKTLGPGHARLDTKRELIRALEQAGDGNPKGARGADTPAGAEGVRKATVTKGKPRSAKRAAPAGPRAAPGAGKAASPKKGARAEAASPKKGARAEAASPKKGGRAGKRAAKERTGGPAGKAAAGARAGAGTGTGAAERAPATPPEGLPDLEGHFVARIRGEEAVREAPHPMAETGRDEPYPAWAEGVGVPVYDERLGELPSTYGDDAFVALPRDPKTAFLYWDHSRETIERSFGGLDHPRAVLWIFARAGEGWERVRTIDFALESRCFYVHDLEPGRTYRAEIHAVDRQGRERPVGHGSNEVTLPNAGPSPVVDDRFIRIPWDMPLGRLLGQGHPGAPFSGEARRLLERLSDWTRFGSATWGSAGGMGGRPSSPASAPSAPPGGTGNGEER